MKDPKEIKAHIKKVIETHRFLRQDYQHKLEESARPTITGTLHRAKGIDSITENITRHTEIMRVLEELIEDVWGKPQEADEIDIDIDHDHSLWTDSIRIKHSQWMGVRLLCDHCLGSHNYFNDMDLLQAYKIHGNDRDVDGNTENYLIIHTPVDTKTLDKIMQQLREVTS